MEESLETKNYDAIRQDLHWLAHECTLEQFTTHRISPYEYDTFMKNSAVDMEKRDLLELLDLYFSKFNIQQIAWSKKIDHTMFPILAILPEDGIKIIVDKQSDGMYKTDSIYGQEQFGSFPKGTLFRPIRLEKVKEKKISALKMFKDMAYAQKKYLFYAIVASISVNILALGSSFYTMQVYDRVIPTNGVSTLISLTIGVFIAIFLEMLLKLSRSSIIDQASKNMDMYYSNHIFNRFLSIRSDTLPKSIGTLSGQLQSYGNIRGFITTVSVFLFIDFPFAFMFLGIIFLLGGLQIVQVILVFLTFSILIGILSKSKIEQLTKESSMASHKKLGLLVETVESAQKVKASDARWNLMGKWSKLSEDAIDDEIRIKHHTDRISYISTFSQQISYVAIVATGAYIIATTTDITMGALIAITILSNKVFAPIAQLPNIFVAWGRAKVSLEDLSNIYNLEQDNEGVERPISHKLLGYDLRCENVKFGYYENSVTLNVPKLQIKKGEKVAILGVIGSGKSTLLKLLSGLYKPTEGRVYIDNLDMQQIARENLSKSIGYLAQENKLFSGTLRDNLCFGLVGVTDEQIIEASKQTGLINLISALPEGLDTQVPEGGESVSGGQKQLIALTRMLVASNDILLLDEPTANMDEGTEKHLLRVLSQIVKPEQTMVIVTHKPALLALVDRIIILTPAGIAMDDKKEVVLHTLQQNSLKQQKEVNNG